MTAPTTPNAELAYRVLDHVDADAQALMQDLWIATAACGTVACFAGWTCLLSGDVAEYDDDEAEAEEIWIEGGRTLSYIPDRAARLLGIRPDGGSKTGYRLFEPKNTREDLGRLVAEIFGPRPEALDEQTWRECAHRADYTSAAHHERECPYHRGEVDEWGMPVDDVPPNAGSQSC